jgi:hypothetical protein
LKKEGQKFRATVPLVKLPKKSYMNHTTGTGGEQRFKKLVFEEKGLFINM